MPGIYPDSATSNDQAPGENCHKQERLARRRMQRRSELCGVLTSALGHLLAVEHQVAVAAHAARPQLRLVSPDGAVVEDGEAEVVAHQVLATRLHANMHTSQAKIDLKNASLECKETAHICIMMTCLAALGESWLARARQWCYAVI